MANSCAALPTISLDGLLLLHPELTPVQFFRVRCEEHGNFRIAAQAPVIVCPICGGSCSAVALRARGATVLPLPIVDTWREDDQAMVRLNPATLRMLEIMIEDEATIKKAQPSKYGKQRVRAISATCAVGKCCNCTQVECTCTCHQREH